MRGSDYAELKAFATVVTHGSFARAAEELRISASTLSQTIRQLEARLGLRLLNRTTRSLSLTDAGARLLARFAPAMAEMEAAVDDAVALRDTPAGVLRVHMPSVAAATYLEPVLGHFHEAWPDIVLDVTIDDAAIDIVEAGYDVGARLGEFLEADMVAVALGGKQRQLAVASPDYIARHGSPSAPADLLQHRCINWRRPGSSGPYKWEFAREGQWLSVAVNGPLVVSSRDMAIAAAVQGVGIAFWAEDLVRPLIEAGKLVPLLDDWCATFPGWFLCYQKQRQTPPAVRAFVDFLRHADAGRQTLPGG
ncbi:LysR family transcriptional regulator [Mesorhizobium qingshengii]|uniref:DNA-binding transcriptional regulator, LysR family n=1 Tax=Mesorhizobium qingshengii TaxID=1165689 RepID=A0A1G5Z2E9_9HYPH|nr:LysR family transcriptional regulator [Mesorhizobium qingshengii]SDA88924.1 DNA-binding transcriptional regulator, LysR family [Mesorhizobium qingshengii]